MRGFRPPFRETLGGAGRDRACPLRGGPTPVDPYAVQVKE